MKPAPFDHHPVETVDEALSLLSEHGDEAKVLAGGQSLIPLLGLRLARPAQVVDVNRLDTLATIDTTDGDIRIGALVRHRQAERSEAVQQSNPLLAAALTHIGHAAIRNRGTVGGSIAHADPAAELPTVLTVLDGSVVVASPRGERTVGAAEFFTGFLSTAIEPDELLVEVRFPGLAAGTGWSFQEFSRRSGDFAVVAVAATLRLAADGTVAEARAAYAGVGSTSVRSTVIDAALVGRPLTAEVCADAARAAAAELDPPDDQTGPAAYRRHLAATLTTRALLEAAGRAVAA